MYYYLLSSMPYLQFDRVPPLTEQEFKEKGQELLKPSDFQELNSLLNYNPDACTSKFAAKWFALETQMRNTLVRARAHKAGLEPADFLHTHAGYTVFVEKIVKDALGQDNPLNMERELDRGRWQLLAELALQDYFGLQAVLCFGLQLKILHRWASIKKEPGRQNLKQIVKSNLASIQDQE